VLTGTVESNVKDGSDGFTLESVEAAIRASWSVETCDPTDALQWTPANPSRGQCAVTALVVHDLFGGQLLEAEVHFHDGSRQGFHYWNRLAGVDTDFTREQFTRHEFLQEPQVIDRLPEFPWRAQDQYLIFRERVHAALKIQRINVSGDVSLDGFGQPSPHAVDDEFHRRVGEDVERVAAGSDS
jgi:hypothetical protein